VIRPFIEEYMMEDGRRINVLGEGRLINLAAAEGHPSSVMDMSFANQALSIEYMVKESQRLELDVHPVPEKIDDAIAREKLAAMGIKIDRLTAEQKKYLSSWTMGT
jgi:adenosylhomocysteinase